MLEVEKMSEIRLDKFISERTENTRSQIKELVANGKITVNGEVCKKVNLKINSEDTEVCVYGEKIKNELYRYILMNKPEGYVCTTDCNEDASVMNLIPPEMRAKGLFPAGRLDKDSLGALLITNDGELAHRILSPKKHVAKIYIVKLAQPFKSKYINLFQKGIILRDGEQCLPARLRAVKNCDSMVFIELHEGKYHEIKRMFATVENKVEKLTRISIGGLILPEKLGSGQCMELLHKDVENLFSTLDFDDFCENFLSNFSAIHLNK